MSLLTVLLTLVIWGLVFYVLWWGLSKIAIGDPWNKVATVVLVIATVVVLIGILTGSIEPFPFLRF